MFVCALCSSGRHQDRGPGIRARHGGLRTVLEPEERAVRRGPAVHVRMHLGMHAPYCSEAAPLCSAASGRPGSPTPGRCQGRQRGPRGAAQCGGPSCAAMSCASSSASSPSCGPSSPAVSVTSSILPVPGVRTRPLRHAGGSDRSAASMAPADLLFALRCVELHLRVCHRPGCSVLPNVLEQGGAQGGARGP
jgi:hypothetical protein